MFQLKKHFHCEASHSHLVKKETLLTVINDVLNVLSHKPDMSFANNAIRIKPNFMLSAFNKWSFDSERPFKQKIRETIR